MKPIVPQALTRESLKGGDLNGTAKGAGMSKTNVVNQHHHHVGRTLRRGNLKAGWSGGVAGIQLVDDIGQGLVNGQHGAVNPP